MWNLHEKKRFAYLGAGRRLMNSETLSFKQYVPPLSKSPGHTYGQILASFQEQGKTKYIFANQKYYYANSTPLHPHWGFRARLDQKLSIVYREKHETFVPSKFIQSRCNLKKRSFSEESVNDNYIERSRTRSTSDLPYRLVEAKRIKPNFWDLNLKKKNITVTCDKENREKMENNKSIKSLSKLGKNTTQDKWYIVVDSEILWQHFDFLESYVQTDSKCVLLIPSAISKVIKQLCVGDNKQTNTMNARKLTRKMSSGAPYITVELKSDKLPEEKSELESIMACCLQAQKDQFHVVLISNNEDFILEAQAKGLYCFTLQEIKDGATTPEPSFDLQKIEQQDSLKIKHCYIPLKNNVLAKCFWNKVLDENNISDDGLTDHSKIFNSISDGIRKLNCKIAKLYLKSNLVKQNEIYSNMQNKYTKSLDKQLKSFCKQFKVNENNFAVRVEEFVCFFNQIMEEGLSKLLQEKQASLAPNTTPPYTLIEAAKCIKNLNGNDTLTKLLLEKFLRMLQGHYCNDGKLTPNTKPCEFMMFLACSIHMIKCLENNLAFPFYLVDAGNRLAQLVTESCLNCVPNPPLPLIQPSTTFYNEPSEKRTIFVKNPSEIILYLKKHFPEWEQFNETHEEVLCEKVHHQHQEQVPQIFPKKTVLTDPVTKNKIANENILKEKMTGAKLLRHLALNPRVEKKLYVDLEKREKTNAVMTNMINEILGNK